MHPNPRSRRTVLIAVTLGASLALPARAADIAGPWLTEDGKGAVEIYPCGAALCGRIVWLRTPLGPDGAPLTDGRNPSPALRQRPLCGLQILGDFRPSGPNAWEDGWIYSPENGKTYHATMALQDASTLRVRGYVGIPLLGETQTWTRAPAGLGSCRTERRSETTAAAPAAS
jgi:uncharacterized protein (DUF2147 family)